MKSDINIIDRKFDLTVQLRFCSEQNSFLKLDDDVCRQKFLDHFKTDIVGLQILFFVRNYRCQLQQGDQNWWKSRLLGQRMKIQLNGKWFYSARWYPSLRVPILSPIGLGSQQKFQKLISNTFRHHQTLRQ